jgi:DNA-directed RNA polymerase specialized sigma24 family protein
MLERILDHRERQQIRKARQRKQTMRYGVIFFAIALVVLAVGAVMEAASPAEEPKVAKPAGPSVAQQEEMYEIEEFADAVTKPLEELSSEDLDLVSEKAEDPCYEENSMLPQDEMVEAIYACKHPK